MDFVSFKDLLMTKSSIQNIKKIMRNAIYFVDDYYVAIVEVH